MSEYLRQCIFEREGTTTRTIAWVTEEPGITKGNKVTFKSDSLGLDGWWRILEVGSIRMLAADAKRQERLHVHHRATTDI